MATRDAGVLRRDGRSDARVDPHATVVDGAPAFDTGDRAWPRRLQQGVLDALDRDPAVRLDRIGVRVDEGVVVLSGTVSTYTEALAAERDVHRVAGVRDVVNDVRVVQASGPEQTTDAEIVHGVRRALEAEAGLAAERIATTFHRGLLTLEGTVSDPCVRYRAERVAGAVSGVDRVSNRLLVGGALPRDDVELLGTIETAVRCVLGERAARVTVTVLRGTVTLDGSVDSWIERDAVLSAARATPGAARVDDALRVLMLID